ncbi:hypothetical protein F5Y19DRAFT_491131 [Xylariaceae sp. FL1651]|nr:hypothetical protein F5Y19DRAFT_491131 [Xylariaceae sp. FL1651]
MSSLWVQSRSPLACPTDTVNRPIPSLQIFITLPDSTIRTIAVQPSDTVLELKAKVIPIETPSTYWMQYGGRPLQDARTVQFVEDKDPEAPVSEAVDEVEENAAIFNPQIAYKYDENGRYKVIKDEHGRPIRDKDGLIRVTRKETVRKEVEGDIKKIGLSEATRNVFERKNQAVQDFITSSCDNLFTTFQKDDNDDDMLFRLCDWTGVPLLFDSGPFFHSLEAAYYCATLVAEGVLRCLTYHAKANMFLVISFLNFVKRNQPPVVIPLLRQWLRVCHSNKDFESIRPELLFLFNCFINASILHFLLHTSSTSRLDRFKAFNNIIGDDNKVLGLFLEASRTGAINELKLAKNTKPHFTSPVVITAPLQQDGASFFGVFLPAPLMINVQSAFSVSTYIEIKATSIEIISTQNTRHAKCWAAKSASSSQLTWPSTSPRTRTASIARGTLPTATCCRSTWRTRICIALSAGSGALVTTRWVYTRREITAKVCSAWPPGGPVMSAPAHATAAASSSHAPGEASVQQCSKEEFLEVVEKLRALTATPPVAEPVNTNMDGSKEAMFDPGRIMNGSLANQSFFDALGMQSPEGEGLDWSMNGKHCWDSLALVEKWTSGGEGEELTNEHLAGMSTAIFHGISDKIFRESGVLGCLNDGDVASLASLLDEADKNRLINQRYYEFFFLFSYHNIGRY